jgi:serine/threonine protein kinase
MGRRSFAGYACQESLSVGLFGEVFRAQNKAGEEARVVVVDSRLAKRKRFASALARHGTKLSNLVHPHLVTTQTVGRGKDGSLVVIASPVAEPLELGALLDRTEGKLPQDVALSIAIGALQGLSHAHEHNVIHGGVHPRSVIVDGKGVTKLADLGLARALASAAVAAEDSELLRGLRGFVAPELALGNEPDVECDVFAVGALISQLLWAVEAPPEDDTSALAEVLRKATSTDTKERYSNAGAFESALRRAISDGDIEVALATNVADYLVNGQSDRTDSVLDSETEDVLNSLDLGGAAPDVEEQHQSTALDEVLADMGGELEGVEDESSPGTPMPVPIKKRARTSPPPGHDLDDEDEEDPTHVEDIDYEDDPTAVEESKARMGSSSAVDAVEAMIRATTPIPGKLKAVVRARSVQREPLQDYEEPDDTPLPIPRPFHLDGTHVNELVDVVGRMAATSSPFDDVEDLPVEEAKKSSNTLRLLAVIAFVFAVLVAVAYTKTDFFEAAKSESAAREAAALAKIEKMQPVPGELTVLSKTEDAAVWLLLGRTPMKSFILPSQMIHELRIQHEGFNPVFMSVTGQHWNGEGGEQKADVSVSLVPHSAASPMTLPAFPPVADPPLTPGGAGQGMLVVESTPVGAEVWMLVGSTPIMNLVGIEAGKDYTFKLLKEGFRPATASFKAQEWYLTGTDGPVKPGLVKQLVMEPLPKSSEAGSSPPASPGNDGTDQGSTGSDTSPADPKMGSPSKKGM